MLIEQHNLLSGLLVGLYFKLRTTERSLTPPSSLDQPLWMIKLVQIKQSYSCMVEKRQVHRWIGGRCAYRPRARTMSLILCAVTSFCAAALPRATSRQRPG